MKKGRWGHGLDSHDRPFPYHIGTRGRTYLVRVHWTEKEAGTIKSVLSIVNNADYLEENIGEGMATSTSDEFFIYNT